jgi:hypothetical protein
MVFSRPHTVPPSILGNIEGSVSFANQFFDSATMLVRGNPKAAGHRDFPAADRYGTGLDRHSKFLCASKGNRRRTQREQDQKLFSTILSDSFVSSQPLPHTITDIAEDGVTRQVAPGVIHQFEMIQIRHNDAERVGTLSGNGRFAVENLKDSASVPEAGQAVSHCLVTKLLLGCLGYKQRRPQLRGPLRDD